MAGEPHPWLWSRGPFHWDVESSQVEAQHRCWPSVSLLGHCTPSLLATAFGASPPCMSQVQVLGLREATPCWILRPGTQVHLLLINPLRNSSPEPRATKHLVLQVVLALLRLLTPPHPVLPSHRG